MLGLRNDREPKAVATFALSNWHPMEKKFHNQKPTVVWKPGGGGGSLEAGWATCLSNKACSIATKHHYFYIYFVHSVQKTELVRKKEMLQKMSSLSSSV